MELEHLAFACPRCGVHLVVPLGAAGVEGPCPKCTGMIRAPGLPPAVVEQPVRLEIRSEPAERAGPVTAFQPAEQLPYVESTAMRYNRKAALRGWLFTVAILLSVAGILSWFIAEWRGEKKDAPPGPQETKVTPSPQLPAQPVPDLPVDSPADYNVPLEGVDVPELVKKSAAVVASFLYARNLDARWPLMEATASSRELSESVLAGPLPAVGNFKSLEVRFDKVLGTSEVFFKGDLTHGSGRSGSYLILVRKRGTQEPKVAAEPFLDTYGGRLADFAARPREESGRFRIVATFFDFCSDELIHGHEFKSTLKIAAAPGGPDLAKAYFGKSSPLREKLERLKVRYGHGTGATVTLRWNTEDVPFLEVIDVVSLDWND